MSSERRHPASPKRLRRARELGDEPRPDFAIHLGAAALLVGGLAASIPPFVASAISYWSSWGPSSEAPVAYAERWLGGLPGAWMVPFAGAALIGVTAKFASRGFVAPTGGSFRNGDDRRPGSFRVFFTNLRGTAAALLGVAIAGASLLDKGLGARSTGAAGLGAAVTTSVGDLLLAPMAALLLWALADTWLRFRAFYARYRRTDDEVQADAREDEASPEVRRALRERLSRVAEPPAAVVVGDTHAFCIYYRDIDRAPWIGEIVVRGTPLPKAAPSPHYDAELARALRKIAPRTPLPEALYPAVARAFSRNDAP